MTSNRNVISRIRESVRKQATLQNYKHSANQILDTLFPQQKQVVLDPSKRKVIVTTRRWGKTFMLCRYLIYNALSFPGSISLYLTPSASHSKRLIWSPLLTLLKELNVPHTIHTMELKVVLDNNSTIWLGGLPDKGSEEKFRGGVGLRGYSLVIVDESGSIDDNLLESALLNVLQPGLKDVDGVLVLAGTPHGRLKGPFYEAATSEKSVYSRHHGHVKQNPMFPRWQGLENWQEEAAKIIAQWATEDGISPTDARYQREYEGLWIRDEVEHMYHLKDTYPTSKPTRYTSPYGPSATIIGIDLGHVDATAAIVLEHIPHRDYLTVLEEHAQRKMTLTELQEFVNQLIQKFQPSTIVIDPSAGGSMLISEITRRYNIPCIPAQKQHKASFINLLRSAISEDKVRFFEGELTSQLRDLIWDKNMERESPTCVCDLADALLYAWREGYQWLPLEQKPEKQTFAQRLESFIPCLTQQESEAGENIDPDDFDTFNGL